MIHHHDELDALRAMRRRKLAEAELDASISANRECWDGDDEDDADTRVCDAGHKAVLIACGVAAVIMTALAIVGYL